MVHDRRLTRRRVLQGVAAGAAPMIVPASAFGASDKLTLGCIGLGGRGSEDLGAFLGFRDLRVVAVCDVVEAHRQRAKDRVDKRYGDTGCASVVDFREIVTRPDIDLVMIGTPDHWHAAIAVEAMKRGKDVYCEKPETLTVREGRILVETARRYGRVFSGGSQRVWQDYQWFHRMVRGGAIGEVREAWVDCGGPSRPCYLPGQPVPPGMNWDLWLGPAPWAPYHPFRCSAAYDLGGKGFRSWREYSGGLMTDWGAHYFGAALFAMNLHAAGPVEVVPPDGKEHQRLTYTFANGVRMYHQGGWGGALCFKGTKGEIPSRDAPRKREGAPDVKIPNYKGSGIYGDFINCVRTRERPFRDVEIAHRTCTVCHLGNIAYWLNRPLKWDPVKEEVAGDAEANRWLDRPRREPWTLI
jgi:predicted dehydrogenase